MADYLPENASQMILEHFPILLETILECFEGNILWLAHINDKC